MLVEHAPASYVPATIPAGGRAVAEGLSLIAVSVISACLCRRVWAVNSWSTVPLPQWLILAIYTDSYLFIFLTAILARGIGINDSLSICSGAVDLCLACYMTTKMIYLFLVERVRLVRGTRKSRRQDHLWLFNFVGMILAYLVVVVLNFLYRFAYINPGGWCILGIKDLAIIPLLAFDAVVNIYLTSLFLTPLRKLYSYRRGRQGRSSALRKMALRSFIGSCVTLILSLTNLLVLTILKGEPGWICLICCNADITFSVVVLQWVTATSGDPNSEVPVPRYVLQRNDSSNRTRRPGEIDIGEALGLPEGQIVAEIRRPCPALPEISQTGSGSTGKKLVKDVGLIPSIPSAEDVVSHCEKQSEFDDVVQRNEKV